MDAILFDLDGTLIDSKRDLARSVQFLQKQFGAAISSEKQVARFVGDGVEKLVQRALPDLSKRRLTEAVLMMKQFYRQHCLDHTRLYPGVITTLDHFRLKKMAVVTNKPVRISGYLLDELGLSVYFRLLIGGDSLPNKKPHAEPVISAMKTMRIYNPKRVVIVGDSPNDVVAGRAAGIYTCGIRSNICDPKMLAKSQPDFIISGLNELMRLFN